MNAGSPVLNNDVQGMAGHPTTLTCPTTRYNDRISWYFLQENDESGRYVLLAEGNLVINGYKTRMSLNRTQLIITNTRLEDAGSYKCIDDGGIGDTFYLSLSVKRPGLFKLLQYRAVCYNVSTVLTPHTFRR